MAIKEDLLIDFGAESILLSESEFLFQEDIPPIYYYQIKKGKIKLSNHKPGDGEFIHSIHEEGESVGEVFLFCKHHRYPVNALAMEDCTVLRLERPRLLQLLESDFSIQMKFLKNCAEHAYYNYVFLNSLTLQDATHQLLTVLDRLKETEDGEDQYSYKVPFTRKELSSLTGLRIETVIRILKKLQTEKVVKIIKGRVYY
ncbi:Crp/Fnr family transcriptional regulator [Chryseobacterium wangxinyae]|uniref:Crp/Fnr family transcriptional regulator n=1 Tax=Chryseobacterium sp. CY353 TaxID=2997334 RepID=UPI00226E5161|nr:Crp/Fnr family transcriptional regulator [Chryseobacterium sp. CY353]MCY0967878.1 Crp/Fnr family transcriptional regulator [Chryseobacterium sp. CY353]